MSSVGLIVAFFMVDYIISDIRLILILENTILKLDSNTLIH